MPCFGPPADMTAFKFQYDLVLLGPQVQLTALCHEKVGRGHPQGAHGAEDVVLGGAAPAHHHTGGYFKEERIIGY